MNKITKNTSITLSLVLAIIGAVFWLTTVWAETKANGQDIKEIKKERVELIKVLRSIDIKVSRIEGKLDIRGNR